MMTSFCVTPRVSFTCCHLQSPLSSLLTHHLQLQKLSGVRLTRRNNRGSLVVTRGGVPGATTYLFAFLFPLSLLAVTIFTSIQISDKLDRDFYQEMEVNQSILEADDEDLDVVVPTEDEEPPRARTRNRPKREVEVSGSNCYRVHMGRWRTPYLVVFQLTFLTTFTVVVGIASLVIEMLIYLL